MTLTTRTTLILFLTLGLAFGAPLAAQETTPQATETDAAAETATSVDEAGATTAAAEPASASAYDLRDRFTRLVNQHPNDLAMLLALNPMLLANEPFLAGYPEVRNFVTSHPEVARNPHFYVANFHRPGSRSSIADDIIEPIAIMATIGLIVFAFSWLVRTVIEQKRWTRLSRTQTEVHNKILDRFGTSEELLNYVRSPAGSKFLESAPIPLHADGPPQSSSLRGVLWSIQIGVVIFSGALGMILISGRFETESARELSSLGVIALCIGAGFIVSAAASIFLSRRLGVWPGERDSASGTLESGPVR